ncbi:MAG: hypothetical protein J5769_02910 [Bacteroidales bacterium]|nr:hypothetical protein [Bacteroidales bacterium]
MKYLIPIAAAAVLVCSCHRLVFEDRRACPSFVFFRVEDPNGLSVTEQLKLEIRETSGMEMLAEDNVQLGLMHGRNYFLEVRKCEEISATGTAGIRNAVCAGRMCTVASGTQWDPVYRFSWTSSAMGGETFVPVRMKKEYSRICVRFSSEQGIFPYTVAAKANTCGMDLVNGTPLKGPFNCSPPEEEPGVFRFTVPRQADRSLALELTAKPGMSIEYGPVDEIVLWNALEKIDGFSWALENLPDIDINIDYTRSQMTVIVNDWELASSVEITI